MNRIALTTFILLCYLTSFGQSDLDRLWDKFDKYETEGDFSNALIYLDSLILIDSENPKLYLIEGMIKYHLNNYDAAVESFTRVINLNPTIIDAYVRRGATFVELEKYEEAIKDFNIIIGRHPSQDSIAYRARALSYHNLGNFNEALADYDSALKFSPNNAELLYLKSVVLGNNKDYQSSLKYADSALAVNPKYFKAIKQKALVLVAIKKINIALDYALQYYDINSADSENNLNLGNIYVQLKNPEKALYFLNKINGPLSTSQEFYTNRAISYFFLSQNRKAISDFEKVIELNPNFSQLYILIADCHLQLNEISEACEYLSKAKQLGISGVNDLFEKNCE